MNTKLVALLNKILGGTYLDSLELLYFVYKNSFPKNIHVIKQLQILAFDVTSREIADESLLRELEKLHHVTY